MKTILQKSAIAAFFRFILLMVILAPACSVNGQNITKVEYFFDTDPGFGKGTGVAVTAAPNISNMQFSIGLSDVSAGFHTLYVRAKDENNRWSFSQVKMFYKADITSGFLPDVTKVEYFIDTDPGFGMGTNIPVAPSNNISNLQFTIGLGSVASGFHTLYIRAGDASNRWSFCQVKMFYKSMVTSSSLPNITKAEYFFDTDPGFGMGSDIPVVPAANISNFQYAIGLGSVAAGFHTLYIRTKDANNRWSLSQVKMFYKSAVSSSTVPNITKAEYFFDTDPGFGMGSSIPVTSSPNINNLQVAIGLGTVAGGFHTLYVRAKDDHDRWSLCQVKPFYKSVINVGPLPQITKVEYFFDGDPGFGMGINVPVTPSTNINNLSFTIDLSSLPLGVHTVWIRAKDANNKWSLVVWNKFTQSGAPVSVAIAASANPVCAGVPVTFTATPVNGGTSPAYQWRVNGLNVGPNSTTYIYTPADHDSIVCILTSNQPLVVGNPATSNSVKMTVKPAPSPVITGISTVCAGTSGVVYSTQSGKSGYGWQVSSGGTITGGAGTNSITVTWNNSGAQTVSVNYDGGNGCFAPAPAVYNVTVNPLPAPTIAGPANPCLGNTGVIYATENGMNNYSWTLSSGGVINGATNTSTISVDWNSPGAQTVSVNYIGSNGCVNAIPATKNVTVNTVVAVSVTISTPATQVCAGSTVTYTAAAVNGGTSPFYQWKVNGVNAGTNNALFAYIPVNNDVVSCVVTSGIPCPASNPATSNEIVMTVLPVQVPTISGPVLLCSGTSGVIYTTEAGKSGYTWQISSGGVITAGGGTSTITVTWNGSGAQTVSVNYSGGNGCPAPSPTIFNVTVNPSPSPAISGVSEVCQGSQGVVYATESGMSGYLWTVTSGGTITAGANTNAIMVTWNGSGAQQVTVNYTSGNGCTATTPASKSVTVSPIVPAAVSVSASSNPSCSGAPVTFTAAPANGGTNPSYQWKVNGITVGANSFMYNYAPGNGDVITCMLTSSLACVTGNPATSNTVTMTVNQRPDTPASSGNIAGCTNSLPSMLIVTPPAGCTADWYSASSARLKSETMVSSIFISLTPILTVGWRIIPATSKRWHSTC